MGKRISGTAYLKVDGAQYTLAGSLDVQPMAVKREGKVGLGGPAGYDEQPIIPYIEGEVFLDAELSLTALAAITDATVHAEMANGKNYILRNAWWAGDVVAKAADGTTSIRFEAMACEEA
ncbi:MAG: phage tail tube protein [Parvibaculum sp.]|nr:phage tail tube protein [Parvibaculum sp.]